MFNGMLEKLSIDSTLHAVVAEGRVDAKVSEMLRASVDLPPPLCPQMPSIKGPGKDDDSGSEGRKGFKWHVCTQLQRNRHGAQGVQAKISSNTHPLQPNSSQILMIKIRTNT